ncbi:MAG: single-stranded DNA-binding protein [Bacteroidales bacterium]|nr:single-stranded DNA-binding protein [Bacteroidales bacterium]
MIGFIGKDPVSTTFDSGKNKTTFSLATSERRGESSVTSWHNVVCWNGLARVATDFLKKGSHVAITGRISYRNYDKDGVKHYATEILADRMQMLDRTSKDEGSPEATVEETAAPTDDIPF